jgi:hypothetical protein
VIGCRNAECEKLHNKVMVAAETYIRLYSFHYIDTFMRKETVFNNYYPTTSISTFATLLLDDKFIHLN